VPAAVARLKRRSEFLRVAGSGNKCAMPGLVVQMMRRPASVTSETPVRYGLTASRRVGNAVERNRVRRRLRAVAEEVLPEHAKSGCDYVLIGRAATLHRPYATLVDDLKTAVGRLSRPRRRRHAVGSARNLA
jgi:ribonuclease P protein component